MARSSASFAVGRALLAAALLLGFACASPPAPPRSAAAERAAAPGHALPPPAAPDASALGWPVRGPILSGFGAVRGRRHHEGIDIRAPHGTLVRAAAAGRVIESRWRRGYGNLVTLDHGDGVQTRYAHLAKVFVRAGARVTGGEPIGTVGATGNATTPHLHFEVRRDGRVRNPIAWLPAGGASETVAYPASLP
jgi:murein DD-endopeptidase MepM/ murein hydrolase activator NlpD